MHYGWRCKEAGCCLILLIYLVALGVVQDVCTHFVIFYIDWYFSTIFVDNLVTYIGYQPYISWGIAYICRIAKIIMN